MTKFYAVKKGRTTGVFITWDECKSQVSGFSGAIYKSFPSMKLANDFISNEKQTNVTNNEEIQLNEHLLNKPSCLRKEVLGKRTDNCGRSTSKSIFTKIEQKNTGLKYGKNVIFCDGGHNKMTGDCAFGSVVNNVGEDLIEKHKELFPDMELRDVMLPLGRRFIMVSNFTDCKNQQNNGAELMAMVAALRIALTDKSIDLIYSDSDLMLKYWSKKLNPEKRRTMDPRKVEYIDELIYLRKEYEKYSENKLAKISGEKNKADLGFHC